MTTDDRIKEVKQCRKELDDTLQLVRLLSGDDPSEEISLVIVKIKEGIMWLGMELKRLGTPNPYPHSYDPSNATVDPTADGLQL